MAIKKRYPIDQSPLFKLTTRRKLSALLRFDLKEFKSLIDEKKYCVFKKEALQLNPWVPGGSGKFASVW